MGKPDATRLPDKPPHSIPAAAELGQLRAALARQGVPPALANAIVKAGRTRDELRGDIVGWQRGLTRA